MLCFILLFKNPIEGKILFLSVEWNLLAPASCTLLDEGDWSQLWRTELEGVRKG